MQKKIKIHEEAVANQHFSCDFGQLDAANSSIPDYNNVNLQQGHEI